MYRTVEIHIDDITSTLDAVQQSRDTILIESRHTISLCSNAIIHIHKGDIKEAERLVSQARTMLDGLRGAALSQTISYVVQPEQEYTEAAALLEVVRSRTLPSHSDLGVMPESYVLGLMDTVGELKRLMLDMLRTDRVERAVDIFDTMESLYHALYPLSKYDKVLKESRRKLDVCRMVLEDSRQVMAQESGRQRLVRAMGFEPTNS